jgi:hypothetical protein
MGTRSPGTPIAPSLSKLKLLGNLAAAYSLDTFFRSTAEKNAAATGVGEGRDHRRYRPEAEHG